MNFNSCNAKGVIFDIDGTIIDSMIIWDKISEDFVREQGKEPELGLNKIVYSMTVDEGCRYMQEHYYPEKSIQEVKDGLIRKLTDFYFNEVQLKPGAKKLIEKLAENNMPMILATTGDSRLAKGALERLEVLKYFKGILSCNDLNTTKGEPDIFYKAIEILTDSRIDSAQAHKFTKDFVVVEDSLKAIKTAKKAGFITIAVKDNAAKNSWDELEKTADYFLDSLDEICFNDDLDNCQKSENKIGIIVGAAPLGNEKSELIELLKQNNTCKIAADGGIKIFIEENIIPDQWLGDMDSAKELGIDSANLGEITKTIVPCVKDDTDMALGIEKAFEAGCQEILIFGGTGGKRISHTFANVQLLHHCALQNKKVTMISENARMFALHNDTIKYSESTKGFLSIFALDEIAKNVKIEGLFYEFHGDLKNDVALGVSNEFIGKEALVSVENGTLLIVEEMKCVD